MPTLIMKISLVISLITTIVINTNRRLYYRLVHQQISRKETTPLSTVASLYMHFRRDAKPLSYLILTIKTPTSLRLEAHTHKHTHTRNISLLLRRIAGQTIFWRWLLSAMSIILRWATFLEVTKNVSLDDVHKKGLFDRWWKGNVK